MLNPCFPLKISVALALVGTLCAIPGSAQGNLFFDTVDVNVVNVEVVVTDKDGQPITDLSRDDFEILEDGKPVELSNFFAVEKGQAVLDVASAGSSDQPMEPETKQLNLVVFVDNANLDPRSRNLTFKKLREYLGTQLSDRDQVMLTALNQTVEIEHDFTNDSTKLLDVLNKMERKLGPFMQERTEMQRFQNDILRAELVDAGNSIGSANGAGAIARNFGAQAKQLDFDQTVITAERLAQDAKNIAERRYRRVLATIDALGQFTDSLAGLPGRKAVLYVSDGLHLRASDALAQAWNNKYQNWILRNPDTQDAARAGRELEQLRLDTTKDFQQLVEYASGNQVAFYPLANIGLMSQTTASAAMQGSNATDGQGAFSASYTALDTMSRESPLLQMADGTGGMAFTRTNNIADLFDAVRQDFETFYSLGYDSPSASDDGKFHKIEVKVKRPGVKVRHVGGHLAKDPLDHLQALTLSALHHELVDNPLEVRLETGEQTRVKGKKYQVPLTVQIPFGKLLLLPEEEFHTGRVSLFIAVLDEKTGGVSKPQHVELPIQVPNDRIFDAITQAVGYPLTLELDSGQKRIAIGVRDNLARLDATLNVEVAVGGQG